MRKGRIGFIKLEFLTVQERLLLGGILIALIWGGIGVFLSSRSRPQEAGDTSSLYRQLLDSLGDETSRGKSPPELTVPSGEESSPGLTASSLAEPPPVYLTRPPAEPGPIRETVPEKININRADKETLIKLPGVGPATARRIIDYRRRHGSFPSWKSLKKVKGIGEKKAARLKEYVTFY